MDSLKADVQIMRLRTAGNLAAQKNWVLEPHSPVTSAQLAAAAELQLLGIGSGPIVMTLPSKAMGSRTFSGHITAVLARKLMDPTYLTGLSWPDNLDLIELGLTATRVISVVNKNLGSDEAVIEYVQRLQRWLQPGGLPSAW